jgi:hypothetical protein
MDTKICSTCRSTKLVSEFAKRSNGKPQSKCKLCQKEYVRDHYNINKKNYIDKAIAHTKKNRDENMKRIIEIKSVPCTDCGVSYPHYVMDFDHLEGTEKHGNVSKMSFDCGWEKIAKEIGKCEVVCSNCHRKRTFQRKRAVSQD